MLVSGGTPANASPSAARPTALAFATAPTPTITGTAKAGQTLTANPGTWKPTAAVTYQWKRGTASISGATATTYKLTTADAGQKITVTVTGAKSGYTTTAKTSAATTIATLAFTAAPTPTITGTAKVGQTLTAAPGTWNPAASVTYQWKRGTASISGATAKTYKLTTADAGQKITVTVTGAKSGYTTTAKTSAATTIATLAFTAAPTPTITGTAKVGQTLTVSPGTWSPTATLTYQWKRGGAPIPGATASTYKLSAADAGQKITVTVTGAKSGYTTTTKTGAAVTIAVPDRAFTTAPAPTVSGVASVGQTLTANPGTWSPAAAFTFQWKRGSAIIPSATAATYRLAAADAGQQITVSVTGTKAGYITTTKVSAATTVGTMPFASAPAPTISGTVKVGQTLTATPGTWSPSATFTYQWKRSGAPIPGATAATYTLTAADAGQKIAVVVTGTKSGYTTVARASGDVSVALPDKPFTAAPAPTISGRAKVGEKLAATPGTWSPAATIAYQWMRGTTPIPGATASTYTLVAADAGASVSVATTGTKVGYTTATRKSAALTVAAADVRVGGDITKNTAWAPSTPTTYVVESTVTVAAGATLSVGPNAIVKFETGNSVGLSIAGSLIVSGTPTTLVRFTSINDDSVGGDTNGDGDDTVPGPGAWNGISVLAGGSLNATGLTSTYGYGIDGDSSASLVRVVSSTIDGGISASRADGSVNAGRKIEITGNTIRGGAISVQSDNQSSTAVPITVKNNTVTGVSDEHPIRVYDQRMQPSNLTGNTAMGNTMNTLALSGTIIENWTIPTSGPALVVVNGPYWYGLTIAAGKTVTAPAGAIVKFETGNGVGINVAGSLIVSGTTAAPVRFTSIYDDGVAGDTNGDGDDTAPASGDWGGISVNNGGSIDATGLTSAYGDGVDGDSTAALLRVVSSTIDGGISAFRADGSANAARKIEITGNTVRRGAISVQSDNRNTTAVPIKVTNNTVTDVTDGDHAIRVYDQRMQPSNLTGNTTTGNTMNTLALAGTVIENWTIPTSGPALVVVNGPYWYGLTIAAGKTVTAPAGAIMKFESGNGAGINVAGSLIVSGTSGAPVRFTSINDDTVGGDTNGDGDDTGPQPDDWAGVNILDGGSIDATRLASSYSYDGISGGNGTLSLRVVSSTIDGGISASRADGSANAARKIEITGNTIRGGAISVQSDNRSSAAVPITVTKNTVSGVAGDHAIRVYDQRMQPSNLTGNTTTGNTMNTLALSGTIIENWTIPTSGPALVVVNGPSWYGLTIAAGKTVTAPAGAIVKFETGNWVGINVDGSLAISGTSTNPVTFTSLTDDAVGGDTNGDGDDSSPQPDDWGGLEISDAGSIDATRLVSAFGNGINGNSGTSSLRVVSSTIDGGISASRADGSVNAGRKIEITGNTIRGGAISVQSDNQSGSAVPVKVANNTVTGVVGDHPIRVYDQRMQPSNLTGNTTTGNTMNTLALAGTIIENWTIPTSGPALVVVNGPSWYGLTIAAGKTVTAPAGAIVKFETGDWAGISVLGSLVANGTSAKPVTLTSFSDDTVGGDTNGDGDDTAPQAGDWRGITVADAGNVSGSGWRLRYASTAINTSGTLSLRDSTISQSTTCISAATFGSFTGSLRDCEIGVSAPEGFDARNVDWGSASGPAPFGDNARVDGNVAVVPWVGYVAPAKPVVKATTPSVQTCSDYAVIVLRGSGEVPVGPADVSTDKSLYDFGTYAQMSTSTYATRGVGRRVQMILTGQETLESSKDGSTPWLVAERGQGLLDVATAAQRGSMQIVPIIYPAEAVDTLFSGMEGFGDYIYSIQAGRDALLAEMDKRASTCPQQRLILAGYSQGAMAIHIAMVKAQREGRDFSHIDGVVLLADPLQRPGEYQISGTGADLKGTVAHAFDSSAARDLWRYLDGDYVETSPGKWEVQPAAYADTVEPYPSDLYDRTFAYCSTGDLFCGIDITTTQVESLWLFNYPKEVIDSAGRIHGGYSVQTLTAFGRAVAPNIGLGAN